MNIKLKIGNYKYIITKEVFIMENKSIRCSVSQCANHCASGYCSLNTVSIGTHEANPTQCQCVDCNSFSLR